MKTEVKRNWIKLDHSAKIYPAIMKKKWSSNFRISATLSEDIDPELLQYSLNAVLRRFPSIAVRMDSGFFWYYLETIKKTPNIMEELSYPCSNFSPEIVKKCAFRVLYYRNRIAVEFFHAITDGTGAVSFVKTLTAEYLKRKYNITVDCVDGVLNLDDKPTEEELQDSFFKNEGDFVQAWNDVTSYQLSGTPEKYGYFHLLTGIVPVDKILEKAKEKKVSITVYLVAIMVYSIVQIQKRKVPKRKLKPVKVMIPVNLRAFFESKTLRNFALYITAGVDPRLGDYSFDEILKNVFYQFGEQLDAKQLKARFSTNIKSEKKLILKIAPLFLKNITLRLIYALVSEKKYSITISNLGNVTVPNQIKDYVKRFDFILGTPSGGPSNCGIVSYDGKVYINFIRNIIETELEQEFFSSMVKLGIPVRVESND